jgi:hypothetical protein
MSGGYVICRPVALRLLPSLCCRAQTAPKAPNRPSGAVSGPDLWRIRCLAPTGPAAAEQSAVRPQAADAVIATLVTATPPAAWISCGIHGYLGI